MIGGAIQEDKAVAIYISRIANFCKNHSLDEDCSTVALRDNKTY
jgi:hypothetical protein